jgi:selenocysteine lyase/cysteine desulfurase
MTHGLSRRSFTELFLAGGSAALVADPAFPRARTTPPGPAPEGAGSRYWSSVREQFLMPKGLAVFNAANLCPSPEAVVEAMLGTTRDLDRDPGPAFRAGLLDRKEAVRKQLAEFLRVTPEEIVITRNTSEANNLVSTGLDLKPGDEVLGFADNHPSNLAAWQTKGKRFGYTVRVLELKNPHPGAEYYVRAAEAAITPRTRVLAFSHITNTAGDVFPARELCRMARERGVLTAIDGAQSFGLVDVDLSAIQPDFYSGSGHKWPCGPKETGVLYVNKAVHDRMWPSILSAYPGAVGISKTLEGFGQRDDGAITAFGEALRFQSRIGRTAIEKHARELAQHLMAELRKVDGVKLWTSPDPERSLSVVTFHVDGVEPKKLHDSLYAKDRIVTAARAGHDRPGIRVGPHLYNGIDDVDRLVAAVRRYAKQGA